MEWRPSPEGIRDNLYASAIWLVLAALGAAVLAGWASLREMASTPYLVILGIGVFGLILFAINQLRVLFRKEPSPVLQVQPQQVEMITHAAAVAPSSEEIPDTIRRWLDDFSFQIKRNEVREDKYFSFTVQADSTFHVEVTRLRRTREQFITLRGMVIIAEADQTKLNSLPERERDRIYSEIAVELRRQKIGTRAEFPQRIRFETRVLISELTQSKLIERVDDVDYAVGLTILRFRLLLDEAICRNEPSAVMTVEPDENPTRSDK